MCFLINDDLIDELAMDRARGTEEEAHVNKCYECQERVRRRQEWIAMFRKAVMPNSANPTIQRRLPQSSSKPVCRLVKDTGT